ncbi:MAG TPA: M12 family metallopeptidase [Allosphingosinicella sp.]|uniref:M12 family metallopeptidase n=1 Tax=Allosphingosinicella sp. TaxID=2823234 RepID=UPI002ED90AA9
MKPIGSPWKEVEFANVDGRAIFEGCIILGETSEVEAAAELVKFKAQSVPQLFSDASARTLGVAIKGQQYRWPKRTIPYEIDPAIPNQRRITDAIAHWHANTSIRFKPRTSESDYVYFRRVASGCASHVGRQGGRQELILADSCSLGNVIHELGHAAGLWHEQSRADRDKFVEIVFSNVDPGFRHNFEQHIHDGVDVEDYDYASIMHYPPTAFSIDGQPTIRPRRPLPDGVVMGQRLKLSAGDCAAIESIYAGVAAADA